MTFLLEAALDEVRLRGHDHFWDVILKQTDDFTVLDIVEQTNAHKASVHDFILRLTRADEPYVIASSWRGEGRWRQRTYRLARRSSATPSLRRDGKPGLYGRGRQQMWNIMRMKASSSFDAAEIAMLAATDIVAVELPTAKEYLQRLAKGRVLVVLQEAAHHRLARYRLRPEMNTGPLAPKLLRASIIYDPNRRTIVGDLLAEELAS